MHAFSEGTNGGSNHAEGRGAKKLRLEQHRVRARVDGGEIPASNPEFHSNRKPSPRCALRRARIQSPYLCPQSLGFSQQIQSDHAREVSTISLTRHECTRLRYYVYLYRDPRTREVFYVGRGKGNRIFAHLKAAGRSKKAARLRAILRCGQTPQIDILAHGLPTENDASQVETAAIDLLGLRNLTNKVRGKGSSRFGLVSIEAIRSRIRTDRVRIRHPVLIFVVNKTYSDGASPRALYHATRQFWRVREEAREMADYALAIFHGIIIAVYRISKWHRAGTTKSPRKYRGSEVRWEFTGKVAASRIRKLYQFRGYDVPQGLIGGCKYETGS